MNNNIARFAAAGVLAVSLVASVSACSIPGSSATDQPRSASQAQAQPLSQAQSPSQDHLGQASTGDGYSGADIGFLYTLDDNGVSYDSETDAISLGHTVCDFLSDGYTTDESIQALTEGGLGSDDAAVVTGASIGAYCPSVG